MWWLESTMWFRRTLKRRCDYYLEIYGDYLKPRGLESSMDLQCWLESTMHHGGFNGLNLRWLSWIYDADVNLWQQWRESWEDGGLNLRWWLESVIPGTWYFLITAWIYDADGDVISYERVDVSCCVVQYYSKRTARKHLHRPWIDTGGRFLCTRYNS